MVFKMILLASAVTLTFVGLAGGAVALGKAEKHPDHPDMCYVSEKKELHAVDSEWQMDDMCGVVSCIRDQDSGLFLSYATCGAVGVDPWCELESDLSLPYPDCCPQPKCPEVPFENDISRTNDVVDDVNDTDASVNYDVTLDDDVDAAGLQEETRNQFPFEVNNSFKSFLPR